MTGFHHYTACGLDWVWLENGYTRQETNHGPATSIDRADDLHRVIATVIVGRPDPIRGQEVRFLRAFVRMGADELDAVLTLSGAPAGVATWEASPLIPIPDRAASTLRAFVLGTLKGEGPTERIARVLDGKGTARGDRAVFHLGPFGWTVRRGGPPPTPDTLASAVRRRPSD